MNNFSRSMYLLTACCMLSSQMGDFHNVQAREMIMSSMGFKMFMEGDFLLNISKTYADSEVEPVTHESILKHANETWFDHDSVFSYQILGGGRLELMQDINLMLSLQVGINARFDNSERYDAALLKVQDSVYDGRSVHSDAEILSVSAFLSTSSISKSRPIVNMPGGEYYRYFPYFNNNYDSLIFRLSDDSGVVHDGLNRSLIFSGMEIKLNSFLYGSFSFNDYRSAGTQAAVLFNPKRITPASDHFRRLDLLGRGGVSIDPGILDKGLRMGYDHSFPVNFFGDTGNLFIAASYTFATFRGLKNFAQDITGTVNIMKSLLSQSVRRNVKSDGVMVNIGGSDFALQKLENQIAMLNHSRSVLSLGAVYSGSVTKYDYVLGLGMNIFSRTVLEDTLTATSKSQLRSFYTLSLGGKINFDQMEFGLGMNLVSFPVAWQMLKIVNRAGDGKFIDSIAQTQSTDVIGVIKASVGDNKLEIFERPKHWRFDLSGSVKYSMTTIPLSFGAKLSGTWVSTCGQVRYTSASQNVACFYSDEHSVRYPANSVTTSYSRYVLDESEELIDDDDDLKNGDASFVSFYSWELELGAEYRFNQHFISFLGVRFGYDNGVTMYPQLKVAGGNRLEDNQLSFGVFAGINLVI